MVTRISKIEWKKGDPIPKPKKKGLLSGIKETGVALIKNIPKGVTNVAEGARTGITKGAEGFSKFKKATRAEGRQLRKLKAFRKSSNSKRNVRRQMPIRTAESPLGPDISGMAGLGLPGNKKKNRRDFI